MIATNNTLTKQLIIAAIMMTRLGKHLNDIATFLGAHHTGIVLISGPMRAGKSALLLMMLEVLKSAPGVLCVKPARDTRSRRLKSRNGNSASARSVKDAKQFRALVRRHKAKIVVFDEAQFSDPAMHQAILDVARDALVIVASLDLNFRAEEFAAYTTLRTEGPEKLGEAFMLVKLTGVCQSCDHEVATHSRLVEEPPEDGDILVGDAQYLTVCATCHSS